MAGYILGLYPEFSCLADRCPATCCSGWKIVVDDKAYQRFDQLSNESLRRDIMGNIVEQDGVFRFANRSNGDCAMLDTDGLCRIQRNTQESMLCNTCRKFPRLSADLSQQDMGIWLSLAASCPVVAEYILDGRVDWLYMDADGHTSALSSGQETALAETTGWSAQGRRIERLEQTVSHPKTMDIEKCFDAFVDIAMDVLDVVIQCSGVSYLEGSFDWYDAEVPDLEIFQSFFAKTRKDWQQFVQQYSCYRYPSRYLEFPQEEVQDRIRQVQGELLLMRVMLCSRYCVNGLLKRTDWMEILHWVYRFCAHGERTAEKIHEMFVSWNMYLFQMIY